MGAATRRLPQRLILGFIMLVTYRPPEHCEQSMGLISRRRIHELASETRLLRAYERRGALGSGYGRLRESFGTPEFVASGCREIRRERVKSREAPLLLAEAA